MPDAAGQSPPSRETATAELYRAANQYSHVAAAIALRHATVEMLRDRQAALHEAALAYAAACGWQPPAADAAP
ncbi:MAG TPA: hypothetical protein VK066_27855 [Chloroflexota bacterium]|nr:hypothetical protein [Chloroflexota bacterium]